MPHRKPLYVDTRVTGIIARIKIPSSHYTNKVLEIVSEYISANGLSELEARESDELSFNIHCPVKSPDILLFGNPPDNLILALETIVANARRTTGNYNINYATAFKERDQKAECNGERSAQDIEEDYRKNIYEILQEHGGDYGLDVRQVHKLLPLDGNLTTRHVSRIMGYLKRQGKVRSVYGTPSRWLTVE